MKKMVNSTHIEGRIYSHDLAERESGPTSKTPGTKYIAGNLEIAVDEECLNVIPVHFTYVTEETKSGAKSSTYTALKRILDENKTVTTVGKDLAEKISVNSAVALNDFYNQNDELVSAKRVEGGFISTARELKADEAQRNTFDTDILITNVKRVEADEEKEIKEHVVISGAIFNFRNDLMPVQYTISDKAGMDYFENLGATSANPVFTRVWGNINCKTKTVTNEIESAFGEPAVRTYNRVEREWAVTGAPKAPYDFGDEKILTTDEVKKAMQDREVMLADVKKRNEEYKAQKAAGNTAAAATTASNTVATGGFTF